MDRLLDYDSPPGAEVVTIPDDDAHSGGGHVGGENGAELRTSRTHECPPGQADPRADERVNSSVHVHSSAHVPVHATHSEHGGPTNVTHTAPNKEGMGPPEDHQARAAAAALLAAQSCLPVKPSSGVRDILRKSMETKSMAKEHDDSRSRANSPEKRARTTRADHTDRAAGEPFDEIMGGSLPCFGVGALRDGGEGGGDVEVRTPKPPGLMEGHVGTHTRPDSYQPPFFHGAQHAPTRVHNEGLNASRTAPNNTIPVYPMDVGERPVWLEDLSTQIQNINHKQDAVLQQMGANTQDLKALGKQVQSLRTGVHAHESRLHTAEDKIAALERRMAEVESRPVSPSPAPRGLEPWQGYGEHVRGLSAAQPSIR